MRNLRASGVKAWLMLEALVRSHGNVLLVRVEYIVKYIHICIGFLMHDKVMW